MVLSMSYLTYAMISSPIVRVYNPISTSDPCEMCQDVVNLVDGEIKVYNASVTIIEQVVKAICDAILIKPEREECLAIDGAISNITKWLANGLDPKQICEKLHICD